MPSAVQWEKSLNLLTLLESTHKQNGMVKDGREDTFSRIAGQSLFGTLSITSEKRPHTEDQISTLKTRNKDDMALRYGMPQRG